MLVLPSGLFPTVNNTNITAVSMCELEAILTLINMLQSDVLVIVEHPEMCSVSMNEERKVGNC
jgi:hypothetical protein